MRALEATRKWLRTCPLIDLSDKFNANYLGSAPTEYTLRSAGDSHSEDVCGYDNATYNFTFAARLPFSEELVQNLSAAEFFGALSAWIRNCNRNKTFPAIDGYQVERVTPSNAGIVVTADANTANYQLQIQISMTEKE